MHQYLDDPSGTASDDYMITVTVSDGISEDVETTTITVNNFAPVAADRLELITT